MKTSPWRRSPRPPDARGQHLSLFQKQGRAGHSGDPATWTMHTASWRRHIWRTPLGPPRESCWTLWAGPWRSAWADPVLYKAFIHGLRYPEQGCCRKTPGGYTIGCWGVGGSVPPGGQHPATPTTAEVVEELVVPHRGAPVRVAHLSGRFPAGSAGPPYGGASAGGM